MVTRKVKGLLIIFNLNFYYLIVGYSIIIIHATVMLIAARYRRVVVVCCCVFFDPGRLVFSQPNVLCAIRWLRLG